MNQEENFLLDTNTASALTQKQAIHHAIIAEKFYHSLPNNSEVYISIVSLYEMEYGAKHTTDIQIANAMRQAIDVIKTEFTILHLSEQGAQIFADIKEGYRQEMQIGKKALIKHNVDFIIAATAIEHNATIISNDHKMFAPIQNFYPGFKWEDWTK